MPSNFENSTFASRRAARTKAVQKADNKAVQEADDKAGVIDGNVDQVIARIGDDPELAAAALAAETERGDKARKGIVDHATAVLEAAAGGS